MKAFFASTTRRGVASPPSASDPAFVEYESNRPIYSLRSRDNNFDFMVLGDQDPLIENITPVTITGISDVITLPNNGANHTQNFALKLTFNRSALGGYQNLFSLDWQAAPSEGLQGWNVRINPSNDLELAYIQSNNALQVLPSLGTYDQVGVDYELLIIKYGIHLTMSVNGTVVRAVKNNSASIPFSGASQSRTLIGGSYSAATDTILAPFLGTISNLMLFNTTQVDFGISFRKHNYTKDAYPAGSVSANNQILIGLFGDSQTWDVSDGEGVPTIPKNTACEYYDGLFYPITATQQQGSTGSLMPWLAITIANETGYTPIFVRRAVSGSGVLKTVPEGNWSEFGVLTNEFITLVSEAAAAIGVSSPVALVTSMIINDYTFVNENPVSSPPDDERLRGPYLDTFDRLLSEFPAANIYWAGSGHRDDPETDLITSAMQAEDYITSNRSKIHTVFNGVHPYYAGGMINDNLHFGNGAQKAIGIFAGKFIDRSYTG